MISMLSWAGLDYDEGKLVKIVTVILQTKLFTSLFRQGPGKNTHYGSSYQSERTEIYKDHVNKLLKEGNAYRCFCTPERLQRVRALAQKAGKGVAYDRHCLYLSQGEIDENLSQGTPFTIRLKTPDGIITVKDLIYGNVEFNEKYIDDAILMKSDGYPTYHLANVIDDHLMGITHVLRGEEWLPSTPKHILLYRTLGWNVPEFAHLPLLLNPDKSKLSKRSGDVKVEDFMVGFIRQKGYLPEALINFVSLLGWSPPDSGSDIFTLDELISENINDIPEFCEYFFVDPDYQSSESTEARSKISNDSLMATITLEQIKAIGEKEFEESKIKEAIQNIATGSGIKRSQVMTILRYIFTGIKVGAGITGTIQVIGKKTSLRRISKVLESLNVKA
ncbi:16883_t:CDS:2 [Acaulospora colombiana]|uniref:16883_t:CDS:1 n=1 Tax=Acaulospora colombiana TaxID=27376 RepID=A0ACA9JY23_9GLOM|nr:16883_t:CDS:2 [Acaulospora colombiana]